MTELQRHFFARIKMAEFEPRTLNDISSIQKAMALAVPFENTDIVDGCMMPVNRENLERKILLNGRGGLCFELNPMFYYFLKDCGFDVNMAGGTVFNKETNDWTAENGHVTTLLKYNGKRYVVDVGFGSFLAQRPIPMDGTPVHSSAGEFRVQERKTEKGTHVLEMQKVDALIDKHSLAEWKIGYAFRLGAVNETHLNRTQKLIATDEKSPFNKKPMAVKLVDNGHISLTPETFTRTINGERTREEVNMEKFNELMETDFGLKQRQGKCS